MLKKIKDAPSQLPVEQALIIKEIKDIQQMIKNNESFFNIVEDEHLIEYAIYEHNALIMRYNHMLSLARQKQRGLRPLEFEEVGSDAK